MVSFNEQIPKNTVLPCNIIQYHATTFTTTKNHKVPFSTSVYSIIPYSTLDYHTLSYCKIYFLMSCLYLSSNTMQPYSPIVIEVKVKAYYFMY